MATILAIQPTSKCHPRIHGIDDSELEAASGVNDFTEERSCLTISIRTPFADVHTAKWTTCSLAGQSLTQGERLVHETTLPARLVCVGM